MTKDQVLSVIGARFVELSAPPSAALETQKLSRSLLSVYDKFNCWAYANGEHVQTTFRLGEVRSEAGILKADVYLCCPGIETKAAVISCAT